MSHFTGTQTADTSHSTGTKTLLLDPVKEPGTCNSNDVSGDAAAGGLAPTARAGFERVWLAYKKHGNKAAARAEFAKLIDPNVDHIVSRAASWVASARPGQRRMPLERWLALEKYDEADRQVLFQAETKSITASNDNRPAIIRGGETDLPKGQYWLEVVEFVDANWMSYESSAELKLRGDDGRKYRHVLHVCSRNAAEERAGRDSYRMLGENIKPGARFLATVTDVVTYEVAA